MRKALFFLTLISLVVLPASILTAQEWYIDKPIVDIQFQGLDHFSFREIEGVTNPFIGKIFSDTLFWDLQSKLYALDYFEQLTPTAVAGDEEQNSVIIVFTVVERPLLDDIRIEGNSVVRRTDILEVILLKRSDVVTKTKVRQDEQAIIELYLSRGFPDIEVTSKTEQDAEENIIILTFEISEGKQTKVRTIQFSGNSFASENTLKGVMKSKEQSFFTSGLFEEKNLEQDRNGIERYYHDRGYIDAKVVNITREFEEAEEDRNFLVITYYIEEGNQYTYGGTTFEGNTLFSDDDLAELLHQSVGNVINRTKLEADFVRITDLYYNDGYIFNVINRQEIRDEENKTISYVISIVERGRAHIENIIVRGNTKTEDYVILREIPLQVGDIFSKDKILEGLRNLYNLQYFSAVIPDTPEGSEEGLMDLVINVEEGKTTDINFGISFSAAGGDFPVMGFVKWVDKNFCGHGQELSVGTEISQIKQSLSFGYTEKWLTGRRWSGGVDLSFQREENSGAYQDILFPIFSDEDYANGDAVPDPYDGHLVNPDTGEPATAQQIADGVAITDWEYARLQGDVIDPGYLMDYLSYDVSLGVNTGYTFHTPLGRFGTGTGLRTSLSRKGYEEEYEESLYRPFDPSIRDNIDSWKFENKLWLNLSWDRRDIIYNPTSGTYLGEQVSFVGGFLGGVKHYIRSTTKAQAYAKLLDFKIFEDSRFKLILALNSAFSIILPQFGKEEIYTDQNDLLYIDGMTTARGWSSAETGTGEALWDNWIELRMPVIEQYLWSDLFISGTGMWSKTDDLDDFSLDDFYFSMGGGLRLTIPGLPIGFYLVKRFSFADNNLSSIQWQTGNVFASSEEGSGLDFVISLTASMF